MKHTTDDLLLAAQVRLLAIEFRRFAFVEARKAADLEYKDFNGPAIAYTDEDAQAQVDANAAHEQHLKKMKSFEGDWYASNSLRNFVKPALEELERIASIIKS